MKKIYAFLMAAAMLMGMSACGEKDNEPDNNSTGGGGSNITDTADASLVSSYWWKVDGNIQSECTTYALIFSDRQFCGYTVQHEYNDGSRMTELITALLGSYTYASGHGQISFYDTTMTPQGTATFTISGNQLTLNYNNETVVLEKFTGDVPGGGDGDDNFIDENDPNNLMPEGNTFWIADTNDIGEANTHSIQLTLVRDHANKYMFGLVISGRDEIMNESYDDSYSGMVYFSPYTGESSYVNVMNVTGRMESQTATAPSYNLALQLTEENTVEVTYDNGFGVLYSATLTKAEE